jgi:repressor LexA
MTPELTAKQVLVLSFIARHTKEKGYPPSLRDIADGLGLKSVNGAKIHVVALKRKGRLTWDEGKARTLKVVG